MDINELMGIIKEFRDERDWKQFHNPKDLAIAVSIESGELMEHFLWKSNEESYDVGSKEDVIDEFADVFTFLMLYADACNIDIAEAVKSKIEKNKLKYPVEKAKGVSTKYTEL